MNNDIIKQLKEHLKNLNISDIEPWTIYKISGNWLFDLEILIDILEKEGKIL